MLVSGDERVSLARYRFCADLFPYIRSRVSR